MMITYNGDSSFTIGHAGAGACTFADGTALGAVPAPANNNVNTVTISIVCNFDNTALAANPYAITVTQAAGGGSGNRFPYTVDFKVDGETVPELSGLMQPVEAPLFGGTPGERTFRFTNEGDRAAVVTELEPTFNGNFLTFEVTSTGDTTDLTILQEPRQIDDTPACVDNTNTAMTTSSISCNSFKTPGGMYLFSMIVNDENAAGLDGDVIVTTTADGTVVTPGFGIPMGTMIPDPTARLYQFRADTIDPVIPSEVEYTFFFQGRFTANGETLELQLTSIPATANCVAGGQVTGTTVQTAAFIYCTNCVPGNYVFTAVLSNNGVGPIYDFFFNGVINPLLSNGGTPGATARTFSFTVPDVKGDPLTGVGVLPPFL